MTVWSFGVRTSPWGAAAGGLHSGAAVRTCVALELLGAPEAQDFVLLSHLKDSSQCFHFLPWPCGRATADPADPHPPVLRVPCFRPGSAPLAPASPDPMVTL